jgi:HAD superfamily hydrolase (TIGR01509 family)
VRALPGAVLFDMDGVLALNSHFHTQAWQRYAAEHLGIAIGDDDARIHGGRNADILAALTGRQPGAAEVEACDRLKEGTYRRLARGAIRPVPGLMAYLDHLAAHRVPCAVVTSAGVENADFVLAELGIAARFAARVTAEDVRHGKPHPEPYQQGARRLGIDPAACLVHEDAPAGVRSAIAAGCQVVALTTTVAPAVLRQAGAARLVADFDEWLAQLAISGDDASS